MPVPLEYLIMWGKTDTHETDSNLCRLHPRGVKCKNTVKNYTQSNIYIYFLKHINPPKHNNQSLSSSGCTDFSLLNRVVPFLGIWGAIWVVKKNHKNN